MTLRVERSKLSRFLFFVLWGLFSRISPNINKFLLYWGLKDGAFPESEKIDPALGVSVFGYRFKTPVGISFDFSQSEKLVDSLIEMGLGFGEFGPYTLDKEELPQKIEFLRYRQSILVSSIGHSNPGLISMIPFFVNRRRFDSVIGVNLVSSQEVTRKIKMQKMMSRATELTAQEEFEIMVQKISPYCDYIAVNISHPDDDLYLYLGDPSLAEFLAKMKRTAKISAPLKTPKILLKLPIDLNENQLMSLGKTLTPQCVDGLIIAGPHCVSPANIEEREYVRDNTTIVFGNITAKKSTELVRKMYRLTDGKIPIIATGGIFTAEDVYKKMRAGASLVQINSALFFKGPKVITDVNKGLAKLIKGKGYKSIQEIIGKDTFAN